MSGGRSDLRLVATELDERLCADPVLAELPGRFLFVLDDGRGDPVDRSTDLGLVALDETTAQLRVGSHAWGPVVALPDDAARELTSLAKRFLGARGSGPHAAWHVEELVEPLTDPVPREAGTRVSGATLPFGPVDGGEHVAAPGGVVDAALATRLAAHGCELVVTPWRGVLVPAPEQAR